MSQQPMSEEVRFRVPLPFVIPVVSLLLIAGGTFGLSRILLAVPKEIAVIIALAVAANLLIAASIVANRPETVRSSWAELLIVFTYPIVVGIVLTQLNLGSGEDHASAGEEAGGQHLAAEEGEGTGLSIAAQQLQFNSDEITIPADEEAVLEFANEDTVDHNVAIYEEQGGEDLFVGDVVGGGDSTSYPVPPLKKGEYYFQCDLHPGMNGTVTVE